MSLMLCRQLFQNFIAQAEYLISVVYGWVNCGSNSRLLLRHLKMLTVELPLSEGVAKAWVLTSRLTHTAIGHSSSVREPLHGEVHML